jgi:hypothetical protein
MTPLPLLTRVALAVARVSAVGMFLSSAFIVSCSGRSDRGAACSVDPEGTSFTLHIHNAGTNALTLNYGCGFTMPITLTTSLGAVPIAPPGPGGACDGTCEYAYANGPPEPCSDCGAGVGADLPPGATVDIPWKRRVLTASSSSCAGAVSCELAHAVTPTAVQAGILTVCNDPPPASGYCLSTTTDVPFTVDTTHNDATIDVQ